MELTQTTIKATLSLAKQIERDLKVRRVELNNGWTADWSNFGQPKYFVFMYEGKRLEVEAHYSINSLPVFGYFESKEKAEQFIAEHRAQLEWYFLEFVPLKEELDLYLDM